MNDIKEAFENRSILIKSTVDCSLVRNSTLLDKSYHVMPVVMMTEGVYQPFIEELDDPSRIYFSAKELKKSVLSWNGSSVSVNHPKGIGTFNSPENYERGWTGFVFNARYEDNSNSLKAELWIEDSRGTFIKELVENGKNIDVSIGVFSDLSLTNSDDSDYMLTNIIADHLAVLPDSVGACSWKDGCGIRAVSYTRNVATITASPLSSARTPTHNGVESIPWGSVNKSLRAYADSYQKRAGADNKMIDSDTDKRVKVKDDGKNSQVLLKEDLSIESLSSDTKIWIASKTLLGNPKADNVTDLLFFPVVNPDSNKLNEGALKAVLSGRGSQANISEEAKTSARNKAESLLKSKFKTQTRGEKMPECNDGKEKEIEVKASGESKKLSLKEYLDQVPTEYRGYLVNSVKAYDANKAKNIEAIVSCADVQFCRTALNEVTDMSLLESMSSLVTAFDTLKKSNANKTDSGSIDYQLKAQKGFDTGIDKLDYVPFYDGLKN